MFGMRQYFVSGLVLLLLLVGGGPALADELGQQQEQVQQQMQVQQEKTAQAQEKVDGVASRLQKVQSELEAAQNDYKSIQTKLSATEQQIKDNTVILSSAEKSLVERGAILNRRIRDIYQNGQLSYLDVLLGANDFSDFATRVDILQRVVQKDLDLIIKVRAERLLILQTRETLDRDRAAILEMKQVVEEKKNII